MGNSHGLEILKLYHNSIAEFPISSNLILGFVSYIKYFCSETLLLSKDVTSFEVLSCSITEKWKKISVKSNLHSYYCSIYQDIAMSYWSVIKYSGMHKSHSSHFLRFAEYLSFWGCMSSSWVESELLVQLLKENCS